jgi:hypothetical protein
MSWLIKFIQKGGDLKGAIRAFTEMNGRMPRTSEMNKIIQAFGAKGNFPKGWTPRVVEGGKSSKKWTDKSGQQWIQDSDGKKYMVGEGLGIFDTPYKRMKFDADIKRALEAKQKTGLKEFTKKEDIYEGLIEPKIDEAAVDFVRRTEGEEAAQAFKKRLMADNEQQLKVRMEIENKEAAERIRKKKAKEDKLSIFTDERPPKDPEFASGGIAGQLHLNQGGRVALGKGGPPNPGRRNFMKLAAGLASIPILGKYLKWAKPAAKAVKAVETSNAVGMPTWFPKLIEKVIKDGKDVTGSVADVGRQTVHKAKLPNSKTDVYVTQDLATGDTFVDIGMGKHGWSDGWNGQPVRMQLKKGEVIQEGQFKGKKSKDEFDIEEAEFTGDAESVKYEDSSFSKYGEQGSDFSEVEKYATGKVSKESKAQKQIWEADWDDSLPDYEDFAKGGLAGVLRL